MFTIKMVAALTLFDYSSAFDGSSHKALDSTLKSAGARRKVRAVHRSICEQANGTVRVRDAAGEDHFSDPFDIGQGSVQGDLGSPRVFITGVSGVTQEADSPRIMDLDSEIRLQALELQKISYQGGDAAARLAAITRAIAEDIDDAAMAENHGKGVLYCGGISEEEGHT